MVWSNFLFKIQMLFNSVERRKLSLFLSCIGFPISFTRSNKVFDAFSLPRFDISSVEFTWFSIFFLWFTLNLLGIGRKENFQIYIANNFFKVSSFVAAKMTTTEEDLGTDLVKRYSFNNCIYSRIKSFWRVFTKILHDFTVRLHVGKFTKIHSEKFRESM